MLRSFWVYLMRGYIVKVVLCGQEHVLSGGRGLMVQGYIPVIKDLAKDINICLSFWNNLSYI